MDERAWLARYLAFGVLLVGGLEWLLGRVVSRLAAAPPIEGTARTIIETLGRTGFFLLSTAFLLASALLFVSALQLGERAFRSRRLPDIALAIFVCVFGVLCLAQTLLAFISQSSSQEWISVTFNLLSAVAVWWLVVRFVLSEPSVMARLAVVLTALAYSGWYWSSFTGLGNSTTGITGSLDALHLGELAAVLTPVAFFLAIAVPNGRWRNWKRWIAPVLIALLFSAGNIADIIFDQGFSGVFSIWSVGFTLFLPFPLYALSLALYLYTLLTCFARISDRWTRYGGPNVGLGLALLFFAGYYLQLTYQHLLAILAILLLTRIARPLDTPRVVRREVAEPASTTT